MKLYLTAVIIALAAVITIVNACMFHESPTRVIPTAIAPFR
jgi:hypothetical protein